MEQRVIVAVFTALSIAAISTPVKAQGTHHTESDLKDSVKSDQTGFSKLVQTLMKSGADAEYPNGFAQVVGLSGPMPVKTTLSVIDGEGYKCHVVYANDDGAARPLCVYFVRAKKTKSSVEERFFRVSLDGRLEKVVTLRGKYDENGKTIRSERSKVDEDIDSPEIKKAFNKDMAYWVKDWLRKQEKIMAKQGKEDAMKTPTDDTASAALDKAAAPAASAQ